MMGVRLLGACCRSRRTFDPAVVGRVHVSSREAESQITQMIKTGHTRGYDSLPYGAGVGAKSRSHARVPSERNIIGQAAFSNRVVQESEFCRRIKDYDRRQGLSRAALRHSEDEL